MTRFFKDMMPNGLGRRTQQPAMLARVCSAGDAEGPVMSTVDLADRLRLVVDSMNEGFGLLAPDFTILELNHEALRIGGRDRDRDDVVGHSYWEVYPGTEHSELGQTYKRAMDERVPLVLVYQHGWPDGRASWFEARVFPTNDGCLAVFFRDVTDRQVATERLLLSERLLIQVGETISEVLYVHEVDEDRISYVSRAYEQVWGRPRAELYGDLHSFMAVVHPEDREKLQAAMTHQCAGHDTETEYRLIRPDGTERVIRDRAFVKPDPVTQAMRVTGVATDITEYRRSQEQIARNAATFAGLVRSNPFGIYVVDADFRLIEVSKGAKPVFASIEPLIGGDFATIIRKIWPEPFSTAVVEQFRLTLATGAPYANPATVERRADIDMVEAYDWRIERIGLPDGRQGVVCYFYDLSERNSYEARLRQAIADKDLLAREIDHRVKNSLTIVSSLLNMQRDSAPTEETQAALDEAVSRVTAIARIHDGLHRSHDLGVVAFGDYLRALCDDLSKSMRRPGLELSLRSVAVDVPASEAMSIALIANELVTNAFKHGATAGATRIEVGFEDTGEALTLTVWDNGGGVPASPTDDAEGLGLSLVDSLARQLGATIEMPPPGTPARFSLIVPKASIAISR